MDSFKDLWDSHPSVRNEGFPCHDYSYDAFVINKCAVELGTAMARCGIDTGAFPHAVYCIHHDVSQGHVLSAAGLAKGLSEYPVNGIQRKRTLGPETFPTILQGQCGIVFIKACIEIDGQIIRNRNKDIIDLWNINRFAFTKSQNALNELLKPALHKNRMEGDNSSNLWFWKC